MSNKSSRVEESQTNGNKEAVPIDNGKQPLRRSRRLSKMAAEVVPRQHQNLSNGEEIGEAQRPKRNALPKKRLPVAQTNNCSDGAVSNTSIIDRKLEAEKVNHNANKSGKKIKKRRNQEIFSIESMLLEPKPRNIDQRPRKKVLTMSKKKKKRSVMTDIEVKQEVQTVQGEDSPVLVSLLPDSVVSLTSTNIRCPDLLVTSEDDHCLPRKIEGPFDPSKFTTGIASFDKPNERKVDEVPFYVTDIFQRLFDAEVRAICL